MRALSLILVALGAAGSLPAQVKELRDVEYARIGQRKLHVDLYLPPAAQRPAPCVVWIHHGGWRSGHRIQAQADARDLAARGLAVASIEHRLSGEAKWPAQIHDCKGAVRWLRKHAAAYGIKADRIAAFGPSSGGHLAAMLATSGGVAALEGTVGGNLEFSSRIQGAVDFYGPTDILAPKVYEPATSFASELIGKALGEIKAKRNDPSMRAWVELAESVDPARYASCDDPPLLIAHGTKDTHVPTSQGKHLYDAARAAGVPTTWVTAPFEHRLPAYVWDRRRTWLLDLLLKEPRFRTYGKGCALRAANEPSIGVDGTPALGKLFRLKLESAPGNAPAIALFAPRRAFARFVGLGTNCSALTWLPFLMLGGVTSPRGACAVALQPPATLPSGIVIYAQWWIVGTGPRGLGFLTSNASRIELHP